MDNDGIISVERKCEIWGLVMLALTVFLLMSLMTDGFEVDPESGRPIDGMLSVPNRLGPPGAFVAGILAFLIGDASHVLYGLTGIWAIKLLIHRPVGRPATRIVGLVLLTGALAGTLHICMDQGFTNTQPGGAFGAFVAENFLVKNFGIIGSSVIALTAALIGTLLATDFFFIQLVVYAQRFLLWVVRGIWRMACWLVVSEAGEQERPAMPAEQPAAVMPVFEVASAPVLESAPAPAPVPRPGWAGRLFSALKPTIKYNLEEDTELPKQEEVSSAPNIVVVGDTFEEKPSAEAPVADTKRHKVPRRELTTPDPFGDVPDPDAEERDVDDIVAAQRCPENDLFAASGELSNCEDSKGSSTEEPLKVETVLSAAKKEPPAPRLRRKAIGKEDELPENYEYPSVYTSPPLDLFKVGQRKIIPNLREKLGETATRLEEMLRTFSLEARVTDVTRGPTITRFELEPAPGMKVSRFLALTDDIALALKAKGVRVEAPIPGKGRVGIEISNEERDPVVIRELLEHTRFTQSRNTLDLALGKDIAGDVCIADLMRMPHLLVAGATGAGKTVCIKALLASLLYQHTPDELQLMLIDPKMVELSIFNDIPHLITPVVTDPKKAATALTWLINEMEERYRLFADLRVRNIEVYNESVENGEIEMEGGSHKCKTMSVVRKLPFIVCVIDELADLMMLARAEVEDAIARLAQLARAVGIHLIIATQRPSVDVLTGVIKANFPARISFQVSSRVDSRCILDEIGAERLIGMGDMLYLPAGQSKPARIQGAFVSDSEMMALIAHLKRQAPPQYRDEIENFGKSKDAMNELDLEDDPLFEDAVRVVMETGQASISMVQRRLRVGYTRAARLIDMMELKGIVGPHTGSKAREILVATAAKDNLT